MVSLLVFGLDYFLEVKFGFRFNYLLELKFGSNFDYLSELKLGFDFDYFQVETFDWSKNRILVCIPN